MIAFPRRENYMPCYATACEHTTGRCNKVLQNHSDKLLQLIQGDLMIGLKQIRRARRLNQQKVAYDLNISREALSYYENGKRQPSLEMLLKMSRYFNVSVDYLITGEEFVKR